MNTDKLVDFLSANVEPVKRDALARALLLAVTAGGAASFAVMLATVGTRPDIDSLPHLAWGAVKLLFSLSIVAVSIPALTRRARPGPSHTTHILPVFLPFVIVATLALASMLLGPADTWRAALRGADTAAPARCLVCVIGFSVIPFVMLIRALREDAPTQPGLCGMLVGLVASGTGAAAYALACNSDNVPFIAVWYSAAIAVYAMFGALVGPRLFRW